jgi:SAM-dependent methyltransferase
MPTDPMLATGYLTDVAYPRAFVPQIAPSTLRLVAALNGHPAPPEDDFDYCDLGSANGDTLTTFAASNRAARFVGVDFNTNHTRRARERAANGELANVSFLDCDFEALVGAGLPAFDFIVAHGVWSWVSARKRAAVLAFVRTHLKPGGLFYVSYNALPGWAAVEPLRRLMRDLAPSSRHAGSLERAREGFAFAQRLADSGAAYFTNHPTAKSMLSLMQKAGPAYVAHEYFHEDWRPEYFADVAREMTASGLGFLGQVPLHDNVRELAIPPSLKKTAESVQDRVALEGLKDFATNELFRSDVYVHGKVARSTAETRYYFEGTPFGTMAPAAQVKREARLPFYTLEYKGPVYDAILAQVAVRARTAMELALTPELTEAGQMRVGDCLLNLALGSQVVPMKPAVIDGDVAPPLEGARFVVPSAYNRLVLAEALREDGPLVFASPVTRGGVHVSLLEALCIDLVTTDGLDPAGYGEAVRTYARTRPMPLAFGDRKFKDPDELARVMAREIERFQSGSLSKLVELGLLAPRVPARD